MEGSNDKVYVDVPIKDDDYLMDTSKLSAPKEGLIQLFKNLSFCGPSKVKYTQMEEVEAPLEKEDKAEDLKKELEKMERTASCFLSMFAAMSIFCILILVGVVVAMYLMGTRCPHGWTNYDGRCYAAIMSSPKDYQAANASCLSLGSTVHNPVNGKYLQMVIPVAGSGQKYWVGDCLPTHLVAGDQPNNSCVVYDTNKNQYVYEDRRNKNLVLCSFAIEVTLTL